MQDEFLVTWNGKYFGWVEDNDLFTRDGRHVGRFQRNEVFGKSGKYLGEIKDHRLITNVAKKQTKRQVPFSPQRLRMIGPTVNPGNEPALDMPPGYEEFPLHDTL